MNAIALPFALPLLAAFLLAPVARISDSLARALGPLALLATCVVLANLGLRWDGQPVSVAIGGFAPPLGINFLVDGVSLLFAGLAAAGGLWLWPWGADRREAALSLLLTSAAIGMALSGDLFNLYVFYELLSVASFGLVAAKGSGAAFVASFRYLALSGLGSALALVGIALVYTQTGTLNLAHLSQLAPEALAGPLGLAAFALIVLGVGVKAELFPVHIWVPEVYATAPARITALLAGVMSKLAVLVIVRLLVLAFPSEEAHGLLLVLGVLGVVVGEWAAWRARDLRRMLAYSSIGQLGLIFIAFSLPGATGLFAGLALALHHLVVKPGLFLLAARWGGGLDGLEGAAHRGRNGFWGATLFVLFALSLVGVPPLPGFWAKWALVNALAESGGAYLWALGAVLAATVVEANYLFTTAVRLFRSAETRPPRERPHQKRLELEHDPVNLASVTALAVVLLLAVTQLPSLGDGLSGLATRLADVDAYVTAVLGAGAAQ